MKRPLGNFGKKYGRKIAVLSMVFGIAGLSCGPHSRFRYASPFYRWRKRVVYLALAQRGKPYRYGAMGPSAFDCSGLVFYVYWRGLKLRLPRRARDQARMGRLVRVPRPGYLLFFRLRGRRIDHVGIYLGGNAFIHAPSSGKSIRIDAITNPYWRRRYAFSRSLFRY